MTMTLPPLKCRPVSENSESAPASEGARDVSHTLDVRVYYQDTDAGGVMYHARYLEFAERARGEWLRALGLPVPSFVAREGVVFAVRRAEIDWLLPARLDDVLRIATRLEALSGARISLVQEFSRAGANLAVLRLELVCITLGEAVAKPARIPERLRRRLRLGEPETEPQPDTEA